MHVQEIRLTKRLTYLMRSMFLVVSHGISEETILSKAF